MLVPSSASTQNSLNSRRMKVRVDFLIEKITDVTVKYHRDALVRQSRECVSTGAAGARTRRSLGHHLLHPLILRLLVLCAPSDFDAQSSLL